MRASMILRLAPVLCLLLIGAGCTKTAFTGRSQLNLLPESQLNAMSADQYGQFLGEHATVTSGNDAEMVKRVGQRLQAAAGRYYNANNKGHELAAYDWQFNLVEDGAANAWCMPGGRVVVYTGILPITQDEAGLAVVMGHEIAHALAHHGNERMSQQMAVQLGGMALDQALKEESATTRNLFLMAYGVGSQVGALLPYSRTQESEADEIGLYLMAIAGYDTGVAGPFWERMSAGGGSRPPEFLSTHPSPENRSANLDALQPKAKEYGDNYGVQK
jgi:predicted Zn-dependent protease